jgi:hypothetical protein
MKKRESLIKRVDFGASVPETIYQTHSSASALTVALEDNIANIKSLNPGWQYKLFDDAEMRNFISDNYGPIILSYFDRINPRYGAARADLFRYLLIYQSGGVYLDIKSSLTVALNDVIHPNDRFLVARWNNRKGQTYEKFGMHAELGDMPEGEIQQWHIVAAPGHPFLRKVIANILDGIDRYNPELNGKGKLGVLKLTGPIRYTLSIMPLLAKHPHRIVDSENELGFVYSIFKNDAHRSLFNFHYSELEESIVHIEGMQKAFAYLLRLCKRFRNFLLRRNVAV